MRHLLRLALIVAGFILVAALDARSQIFRPFFIHNGYASAYDKARDTLAADAYLVYAGTFGDLDLSEQGIPVVLNFYQDEEAPSGLAVTPGQADAWGYVFYSPSQQRTVSLVVLNSFFLGGYFAQGVPVDLPLPDRLVDTLDLAIDGTHSDSLMARVKRNDTYVAYHGQYPMKQPSFVTLGVAIPDEIDPPGGFDLSGPIWTMTFRGGGDTAGMICLVAAVSGETFCETGPVSSVATETSTGAIALRALPSPASDHVRIVVDNAGALRGAVTLELLDAAGRHVRDLGADFAASGFTHAVVDASELPSGTYFCRLLVDGASTTIALPIVHE
jgi:hypothetical protein